MGADSCGEQATRAKFAVMRAGGWRDDRPLPSVLAGERIGLIGLGEIGGRVARVASAFGMQVIAWSRA